MSRNTEWSIYENLMNLTENMKAKKYSDIIIVIVPCFTILHLTSPIGPASKFLL
jgi:hypothetical protein